MVFNLDDKIVSIFIQSQQGVSSISATTQVAFDTTDIMDSAIAIIGLFFAGICICRMNSLTARVHLLKVRLRYLCMFVGSLAIAGAPWFWPNAHRIGALFFLVSVTLSTIFSTPDWLTGPPPEAFRKSQLEIEEYDDDQRRGPVGSHLKRLWRKIRRRAAMVHHFFRGSH